MRFGGLCENACDIGRIQQNNIFSVILKEQKHKTLNVLNEHFHFTCMSVCMFSFCVRLAYHAQSDLMIIQPATTVIYYLIRHLKIYPKIAPSCKMKITDCPQ